MAAANRAFLEGLQAVTAAAAAVRRATPVPDAPTREAVRLLHRAAALAEVRAVLPAVATAKAPAAPPVPTASAPAMAAVAAGVLVVAEEEAALPAVAAEARAEEAALPAVAARAAVPRVEAVGRAVVAEEGVPSIGAADVSSVSAIET